MGSENYSINWDLCCLCQDRFAPYDLRSTKGGRETLEKQLIQFKDDGAVLPDGFGGFKDSVVLCKYLEDNNASYHKKCYNDYNNYHLVKLKRSLESNGGAKSVPVKDSRRRSSDWQLGDLRCSICSQNDVLKNLHMAAETPKKKKTEETDLQPKDYLQQKTEEWRELAKTPGYENLCSKICVGDLKSNEIFYHNKYWTKLKRDAEAYKKQMEGDDQTDPVLKFRRKFCMRKVYRYVFDTLYDNPSICVELRVIFERYKDICEKNEVPVDPNITRFKSSFKEFMSDDLEIMLSGKILYVGWEKTIKKLQYQQ